MNSTGLIAATAIASSTDMGLAGRLRVKVYVHLLLHHVITAKTPGLRVERLPVTAVYLFGTRSLQRSRNGRNVFSVTQVHDAYMKYTMQFQNS
jgi:hypothetical protein